MTKTQQSSQSARTPIRETGFYSALMALGNVAGLILYLGGFYFIGTSKPFPFVGIGLEASVLTLGAWLLFGYIPVGLVIVPPLLVTLGCYSLMRRVG